MQPATTAAEGSARNTALWIAASAVFVGLLVRNAGLYPCVVADETVHSRVCRLVPLWEAEIPAYLYAIVYRLCNHGGDDFQTVARILNGLFFVGSTPFLFWTARRFCSSAVAAVIAIASLLGPVNTYTAYFMPEPMYFFGFWVLAWLTGRCDGKATAWSWCGAGFVFGLLALIKPHALFAVPGVSLYCVLVAREAPTSWLAKALRDVLALVGTMLLTRAIAGWACAGADGLYPFGKLYGNIASTSASRTELLWAVAKMASWNAVGHALSLCLTCGLAIAATLGFATRTALVRGPRQSRERFALFTFLVLANLVAMTTLFTASVACQTAFPNENGLRLHMRYYEFVLPALFMVAGSQVSAGPNDLGGKARLVLAASVGAFITYAVVTGMQAWPSAYHDNAEVRGYIRDTTVLWLLGCGSLAVLAAWARRASVGAALFAFAFLPIANFWSTHQVAQDIAPRRTPDAYDLAGQFARQFLTPAERAGLCIVGASPSGIWRSAFHADSGKTSLVEIPANRPFDEALVPGNAQWILHVGTGWTPDPSVFSMRGAGFVLARARGDLIVDFRLHRWFGLLVSCSGVSDAVGFGRFSTGKVVSLEFERPLPKKFSVVLLASAFGPNEGKEFVARIGTSAATFTLKHQEELRHFDLDNPEGLRTLTIEVPNPISPKELGTGPDERPLGIGLVALTIVPK